MKPAIGKAVEFDGRNGCQDCFDHFLDVRMFQVLNQDIAGRAFVCQANELIPEFPGECFHRLDDLKPQFRVFGTVVLVVPGDETSGVEKRRVIGQVGPDAFEAVKSINVDPIEGFRREGLRGIAGDQEKEHRVSSFNLPQSPSP